MTLRFILILISFSLFCGFTNNIPKRLNKRNIENSNNSAKLTGVSTFESIGLYFETSLGSSDIKAKLYYKKVGESTWIRGHDLWWDNRELGGRPKEYRGSIVHLTPETEYNIEVRLSSGHVEKTTIKTWTDVNNLPIASTNTITNLDTTLRITTSGTESGYIVYDGGGTGVINASGVTYGIKITNASYIIIKGIEIKNAKQNGIRILGNCNHIIIDNCDIHGWGRFTGDGTLFGMEDAGIYAYDNNSVKDDDGHPLSRLSQLVIQNCTIHQPRADCWAYDEFEDQTYYTDPTVTGTIGIDFLNAENSVIRNNQIYGDKTHYMRKSIGGGWDYSYKGSMGKDCDVYGNYSQYTRDDAIENDGGNINVRLYDNLIEDCYVAISIAPVSIGPMYIFDNIVTRSRKDAKPTNSNDWGRGTFIKTGGDARYGQEWRGAGRVYIYHNTIVQPQVAGKKPLGVGTGISGSGGDIYNIITRNNIITPWKSWKYAILGSSNQRSNWDNIKPPNDFDHDVWFGKINDGASSVVHEQNGLKITKLTDIRFKNESKGDYTLLPSSVGYEAGVRIYNFNDNYVGKAPDMGAIIRVSDTQVKPSINLMPKTPQNFSLTSSDYQIYLNWNDPNKSSSLIKDGWNFNKENDLELWNQTYNNTAKIQNDRLKIIDNGTAKWTSVTRIIDNLQLGTEYYLHDELFKGTADYVGVYLISKNGNTVYLDFKSNTNRFLDTSFVAKSTSIKLFLQIENDLKGNYGFHDNIKIQKITNPYTGFEIWMRKYNSSSSDSWILQSTVENSLKNYYKLNVSDYAKYGFKIRFFLSKNNKNIYSDFSKEEIITTTSNKISLNNFHSEIKVLLEGPYINDKMETTLVKNGFLPINQPFNNTVFNFTESQKVSIFPSTVVDWILVELRSNLTTRVKRFAALLNNDGFILNIDGSNDFSNQKIPNGNYYLVIYHRNHLPIMSSSKISVNNSVINYDFTTNMNKAYGNNSMTKLPNGKFAMYAGDGDNNKKINELDYKIIKNNIFSTGYINGDIDMNGIVNVLDYSKINQNINTKSNIP